VLAWSGSALDRLLEHLRRKLQGGVLHQGVLRGSRHGVGAGAAESWCISQIEVDEKSR
jgi:hypothetical protein